MLLNNQILYEDKQPIMNNDIIHIEVNNQSIFGKIMSMNGQSLVETCNGMIDLSTIAHIARIYPTITIQEEEKDGNSQEVTRDESGHQGRDGSTDC